MNSDENAKELVDKSRAEEAPEEKSPSVEAGSEASEETPAESVAATDKAAVDKREKSRKKSPASRKKKADSELEEANEEEDEEDIDDDEEGLDNLDDLTGIDDPLAPAFDLDRGAPLKPYEDAVPWQTTKVASAKEFFTTEVLYRFDIIDPDEVKPLEGTYRVELKGDDGGVWTISIGNSIEVSNTNEEAETVPKMHQRDFLAIVNGKLNPQLAILSQKIKVQGEVKRAIRFQEILGPSSE